MHLGKLIATHPLGAKKTTATVGVKMDLLCDGGSRPNPGISQPVVHDGSTFLKVPQKPMSGNHSAVYDSVDHALDHAHANGITDVEISLSSRLIWGQLTGNAGHRLLAGRLQATEARASRFRSVTWHLVAPPFHFGGVAISSSKALRRAALRAAASSQSSVTPIAAKVGGLPSALPPAAPAAGPTAGAGGNVTPVVSAAGGNASQAPTPQDP